MGGAEDVLGFQGCLAVPFDAEHVAIRGMPERVLDGVARETVRSGARADVCGYPARHFDVAPDGQRFYAMLAQTPPSTPVVTHINLVQNWVEDLKTNVPVAR